MSQPLHPCRPASYSVKLCRFAAYDTTWAVYRNDVLLSRGRAADAATAVSEARRAVRIARQCSKSPAGWGSAG